MADPINKPFSGVVAAQQPKSLSDVAGDDSAFLHPYIAPGLSESDSFLAYKNQVQYIEDNEVVRHKDLEGEVSEIDPTATPKTGIKTWSRGPTDCIQVVTGASPRIRLVGYGIRMGFHVQPPRAVMTADGVPLVQTRAVVSENAVLGNIQGIFIYRTDWDIEYVLESVPETIPSAGSPEVFVDKTVAAPLETFIDAGDADLGQGIATAPIKLGEIEFQQGVTQ